MTGSPRLVVFHPLNPHQSEDQRIMKTRLILLVSFCLAQVCGYALPAYEPFADATGSGGTAYTVGAVINGQTNAQGHFWSIVNTAGTGSVPTNFAGNLSYTGLPSSSGNSLLIAPISGGKGARIAFKTNVTTGTFYASFVGKWISTNGMTPVGVFWPCFNNTIGDSAAALSVGGSKIFTRLAAGGFQLGLTKNSTAATDVLWDTTVRTTNDTLFVSR